MGFGDWIKDIVSAPVEDEYENEQVETQETVGIETTEKATLVVEMKENETPFN